MTSLTSLFSRFTLCSCLTATLMITSSLCSADDPFASTCPSELADTEEACGWVEMGTHDSMPATSVSSSWIVEHTMQPLESRLSALAALACARMGVSVEQIVEPFAMVGPYMEDSVQAVQSFQEWWKTAQERTVELQGEQVEATPAPKEIDYETLGPSVLVRIGVEVTPISALVGGAPMIATLEETYLPYDLSAKDMRLWSVFPVSTRPFCIRSRVEELVTAPMWPEFDDVADVAVDPPAELPACFGSADCLLEDLIWKVERAIEGEDSPLAHLAPNDVGRTLAAATTRSGRAVASVTRILAQHWPEAEQTPHPSPTGEALLARAGAVEAGTPMEAVRLAKSAESSVR